MKRIFVAGLISMLFISCKYSGGAKSKSSSISESAVLESETKQEKSEINPNLESELFVIEGIYFFYNDVSKCSLRLDIVKENEYYRYNLKTNTRNLSGSISLNLNEESDGYYVSLDGIEWSENDGPLNAEGAPIEGNIILPQGIKGSIYKAEIVIQNYGNAMNSYLQLGECDEKYILLKKE